MYWPSFWHSTQHSTFIRCSDIVALFFFCFLTYVEGTAMRWHFKVETRAVCHQRPCVTVLLEYSMVHMLALENLRLGSKISQADGWVSHFHLPGSTVRSMDWYTQYFWGEILENSAANPGRITNREEAKHIFQGNVSLILKQASLFCWELFNSPHTPYSLDRWTKRQTHAYFGLNISLMKYSFRPPSMTYF